MPKMRRTSQVGRVSQAVDPFRDSADRAGMIQFHDPAFLEHLEVVVAVANRSVAESIGEQSGATRPGDEGDQESNPKGMAQQPRQVRDLVGGLEADGLVRQRASSSRSVTRRAAPIRASSATLETRERVRLPPVRSTWETARAPQSSSTRTW